MKGAWVHFNTSPSSAAFKLRPRHHYLATCSRHIWVCPFLSPITWVSAKRSKMEWYGRMLEGILAPAQCQTSAAFTLLICYRQVHIPEFCSFFDTHIFWSPVQICGKSFKMGWSCALAGLSETLYWIPSKEYIRSLKVIGDQTNCEYESTLPQYQ